MRSHYCGQLNETLVDQTVTVCGWVHRRRDHGGVIFLDMRDRDELRSSSSTPIPPRRLLMPTVRAVNMFCVLPGVFACVPKAPRIPTCRRA